MENSKLIPGNPSGCKCHSMCPVCEHLLKCSEDDEAWVGDSVEDVRTLAFVSALIQTNDVSEKTETRFLNIFQTRICAELGKCTPEDISWAKSSLECRRQKIEELERGFAAEVNKLPFDGDMDLIREYAEKLDRFCGPAMTEEEYWGVINRNNIVSK